MNDLHIITSALLVATSIIAWWIYRIGKMRSEVKDLTTVFRRNRWQPWKDGKKYELSIARKPFAYRAYNSFFAFLNRHIIVDRFADSECDHPERDQRR